MVTDVLRNRISEKLQVIVIYKQRSICVRQRRSKYNDRDHAELNRFTMNLNGWNHVRNPKLKLSRYVLYIKYEVIYDIERPSCIYIINYLRISYRIKIHLQYLLPATPPTVTP